MNLHSKWNLSSFNQLSPIIGSPVGISLSFNGILHVLPSSHLQQLNGFTMHEPKVHFFAATIESHPVD